MSDTEQCSNCRFWVRLVGVSDGDDTGECRRYPPTVFGFEGQTSTLQQAAPEVSAEFWCGEHEPIESEEPGEDETLDAGRADGDDNAL